MKLCARSVYHLLILLVLSLTLGCTSSTPNMPCIDADCFAAQERKAIADRCISHLFWYPRHQRKAIDREYRYPFTNAQTFDSWVKMGNVGPSPWQWCKKYAAWRTRTLMPAETRVGLVY